jgi:hypothetical protein
MCFSLLQLQEDIRDRISQGCFDLQWKCIAGIIASHYGVEKVASSVNSTIAKYVDLVILLLPSEVNIRKIS